MRTFLVFLALCIILPSCAQKYIAMSAEAGVQLDHKWKFPKEGPAELMLRISNTSSMDKRVALELDLSHDGLTQEIFSADTCIRGGQVLSGKLNGFYFQSSTLNSAEIQSTATKLDAVRFEVRDEECR